MKHQLCHPPQNIRYSKTGKSVLVTLIINSKRSKGNLSCFYFKVAQTRLENRTYRPNVELCRDQPQYQMCHEAAEISGSIRALNEKLREAENALQALRSNLERINEDLAIKNNSLALDNRSMEVRQKMKEIPHSMMNTGQVFNTIQNSSRVPTMENVPFTEAQGTRFPSELASPRPTGTYTPPITGRRVRSPLVD